MRILITGGAGFIGSHLCEKLLAEGNEIICLDNFFTGKKENIAHLFQNKNFSLMEHDIINEIKIDKKLDQIYNLACPASPVHYQENPIRTIKANTIGVINVLGLARKHKARILQASTSEVYGDPTVSPQREDYMGNVNTIGPRACYDEGKRVAEALFYDYKRSHNMEIRVARIFNTYGPKMAENDGRVVSNFVLQALQNKSITAYGDGSQTRSFCYVDDMVDGLIKLMNSDYGQTPVNLGNPEEIKILDVAKKIISATNSKSEIIFLPLPENDPHQRCPDINLAKKIFSWSPKIFFDDGILKVIHFFSSKKKNLS